MRKFAMFAFCLSAFLGSFQIAHAQSPVQLSPAQRQIEELKRALGAVPVVGQNSGFQDQNDRTELMQGMQEIANLAAYFCMNIYPKPTVKECVDKIKHGIGQSADPHSEYMNADETAKFNEGTNGRFGGLGIELFKPPAAISPALVVNTIEGTPAERAGLLSGDAITHIYAPSGPVPTVSLKVDEVVKMLRGDPGTSVKIRIARKGVSRELEFTMTREVIKVVMVEGDLIQSGNKTYAYLKVKQFGANSADMLEKKYLELAKRSKTKLSGVILSFENNPGGLLHEARNQIRLFVTNPKELILIRTNDEIAPYLPEDPRMSLHAEPRDITGGLPILAIVNGGSASASEVVTKALKHANRATIAGTSETFGKGIVQTVRQGRDGTAIKYTSSEYLIGTMNDWVPVQCTGVGVDILFEYPNVKKRESLNECMLSGHVQTKGPMQNPPVHQGIKEANPAHYQASLEMLEAYKVYILPKMQKQEADRKALEEQAGTSDK